MNLSQVLAVAVVFGAGTPAFAMDAYTRGPVTLQAAPPAEGGHDLPHCSQVDIRECAEGWCLVQSGEAEGWVREDQLTIRGHTP